MLIKIAVVITLLIIFGSLFSALFYLVKDKGNSTRTAKALTIRITISIVLFILLMLGYLGGYVGHPL